MDMDIKTKKMKILEKLNIGLLPPKNLFIKHIPFIDVHGQRFHFVQVYGDFDFYNEKINELLFFTYPQMHDFLKIHYGIKTLKPRNFENFKEWYEKISKNTLTKNQIETIKNKFN